MKKRAVFYILFILTGLSSASMAQAVEHTGDGIRQRNLQDTVVPRKFHISDYLSVGGMVNFQYDYTNQTANDNTLHETGAFQIRRARLDLKGNITPRLDFRLQADFANSPKLVDGYVRVKFCRYINLQAGQFKTPFTLENPYAPLDLEFADNAQVISALAGYKDVSGISSYTMGRELGIQLYGTLAQFERDSKKYPLLTYYIGIFGGNGVNVKTDNMAKDLAGRIEFRPFIKHLTLSGSAYWGRYDDGKLDNLLRLRYSGGAEYKDGNLTIRSEYVWGKTGISATNESQETISKEFCTQGFYLTAGYWFHFGWGKFSPAKQKLRPVLRYDYYQKDLSDSKSVSAYYSAGIDWWPEKHLNLRVSYTLRDIQKNNKSGHEMTAMLSVKF